MPTKDSANVILDTFEYDSIVPTNTNGLRQLVLAADAYFKLGGATNPDNNVIFGVSIRFSQIQTSVNTLDDTPTLQRNNQ